MSRMKRVGFSRPITDKYSLHYLHDITKSYWRINSSYLQERRVTIGEGKRHTSSVGFVCDYVTAWDLHPMLSSAYLKEKQEFFWRNVLLIYWIEVKTNPWYLIPWYTYSKISRNNFCKHVIKNVFTLTRLSGCYAKNRNRTSISNVSKSLFEEDSKKQQLVGK